MKRSIAISAAALGVVVVSATGAFAAARGFDRGHADKQNTAASNVCLGKTATIIGTTPIVKGTSGNDVIVSLYFNAEVYGFEGDDTICLYNGGSVAIGGPGRDAIWVDGNDNHVVLGGTGDDVVVASNKSVTGLGTGGKSILIGNAGADKIYGGGDGEWIFGLADADYLRGGDGNDYLRGGSGSDDVKGEAGTDDEAS